MNLSPAPELATITKELETTTTSPCYLILSSGTETAVLEKDLTHARINTSTEFIVATNCDCEPPATSDANPTAVNATGMEEVLEFADERKDIVEKRFKDVKKRQEKKWSEANEGDMQGFRVKVRESTLLGWLQLYPVWNELTHFGCLMDPIKGDIRWIGRGVLEEKGEEDESTKRENGGWRNV